MRLLAIPTLSILALVLGCRVPPPDTSTVDTEENTDSNPDSGPTVFPAGACGSATEPGISPEVRTVVVLVTDGARIDETFGDGVSSVTGERTEDFWPRIRSELLPQGTIVLPGLATGVTITAEGHAALLTGQRVPQANFPSDDGPGMYRPEIPTLFERLRIERSTTMDSVALLGNTVHLGGHGWSLEPRHGEGYGAEYSVFTQPDGQPVGSDTEVITGVRDYLENHDTHLLVANLHQMDRAGHYNVNPSAYASGVRSVDGEIVEFWNWLQEQENYADQTLLVIVADHGRHRWNEAEDYRHHGDQCTGCRQIPMFMVGPGVRQGHRVSDPYTIEDLGSTLAWLMDVDLPHADGQILCEALEHPPANNGRSGMAWAHSTSDTEAQSVFGEEPSSKTSVWVDGALVSSEDALHAEAPRVWFDGAETGACWRELGPGPGADALDSVSTWSWEARCVSRRIDADDSYAEMTVPVDTISPYWRPSFALDGSGHLLMAYADNQSGNWEASDQAIRLLLRANGEWMGANFGIDAAFPLDPVVAASASDDRAWVAFSASNDQTDPVDKKRGRFLRHIEVWQANTSLVGAQNWSSPDWAPVFRTHTATDTGTPTPSVWDRMEHPTLHADPSGLQLAFVGISETLGNTVGWAASDADGIWSEATHVPGTLESTAETGTVLAHIAPAFTESGRLVWLQVTEDSMIELCSWTSGEEASSCADLGARWVREMYVDGTSAYAIVSDGAGTWSRLEHEVSEPDEP